MMFAEHASEDFPPKGHFKFANQEPAPKERVSLGEGVSIFSPNANGHDSGSRYEIPEEGVGDQYDSIPRSADRSTGVHRNTHAADMYHYNHTGEVHGHRNNANSQDGDDDHHHLRYHHHGSENGRPSATSSSSGGSESRKRGGNGGTAGSQLEPHDEKRNGGARRHWDMRTRVSREQLLQVGRAKLKAWKENGKAGLDTLKKSLSEREDQEKAAREELDSRIADLKREVKRLSREKADSQIEVSKLLGVANNLQEGLRTQEDIVREMCRKYEQLEEEKRKVETEKEAALAEAASVREMLTQRGSGSSAVVKTGASPRVDLTQVLKQASRDTECATLAIVSASARLKEIKALSQNLLTSLRNLNPQVSLPPTPSGEIPLPVLGGGGGNGLQGVYPEMHLLEGLLTKGRTLDELLDRALKELHNVEDSVHKAHEGVSPGRVQAVLLKKARHKSDLGLRREDADVKKLIVEVERQCNEKQAEIKSLHERCQYLSRERSELSSRLSLREEETKLAIDTLKKTVSDLLSSKHMGRASNFQLSSGAAPLMADPVGNNEPDLGNPFLSPGKDSGMDRSASRGSRSATRNLSRHHKRRRRTDCSIKVFYGSESHSRVNLWESLWPGPLNCRKAPTRKAALVEATLDYGAIVVAEKVVNGWIEHAHGWTEIKDGKNRYMARLPLCSTPLGMAYVLRKPRFDGLTNVILTWCKGYGVMASLKTDALIADILNKSKTEVTKALIAARGELKSGNSAEDAMERVNALESKLAELMNLSAVTSVAELLSNLEVDRITEELEERDGGNKPSELASPGGSALQTATPRNVVTDDGSDGILGVFSFLLSIVGLDDEEEEDESNQGHWGDE